MREGFQRLFTHTHSHTDRGIQLLGAGLLSLFLASREMRMQTLVNVCVCARVADRHREEQEHEKRGEGRKGIIRAELAT